tara:strand:+ start:31 stop:450 length:420 start_codon:yes stop_codon:yes gene_type:complete
MKAVKKYWHGGRADWKPDNWNSLAENKKRLLRIKHKAETAFDAGDTEEAKELAAKAAKIEKRQKKWKDGIDRYVAEQDRRSALNAKERARSSLTFGSMDSLMDRMHREQLAWTSTGGNRPTAQTVNKPRPKASTTKKTR